MNEADAQAQIRATLSAYNMAGDRGRIAGMLETFLPEAELETVDGRVLLGREALGAYFRALAEGLARSGAGPKLLRHHLTTSEVSIEGADSASSRTYVLVITENGLDHSGMYVDRFARRQDQWLIARRKLRVDWIASGSPFRALLGLG